MLCGGLWLLVVVSVSGSVLLGPVPLGSVLRPGGVGGAVWWGLLLGLPRAPARLVRVRGGLLVWAWVDWPLS